MQYMEPSLSSDPTGEFCFPLDIAGAGVYICTCLRDNLISFLTRRGVQCSSVRMELESLVITYNIMESKNQEEKLSLLLKRYCQDVLSTISMEMIPGLAAADAEWVKDIVMKESKG